MDVFRRFTSPTLKKLYRFVLKLLVGRFLDKDITLEQLNVQLGAGRIELTDISINVSALEKLLPDLSFRLARAHVGRLRVEISYTKLLTESLAFYLDDVLIVVAPAGVSDDGKDHTGTEDAARSAQHPPEGVPTVIDTSKKHAVVDYHGGSRAAESERHDTLQPSPGRAKAGEAGEGLDFLAHWIEQITSKVKVVVDNIIVRTILPECGNVGMGKDTTTGNPHLQVHCSSITWCDETPESSVLVMGRPLQTRAAIPSVDGYGFSGKPFSSAPIAHKRLTVGPISAGWNENPTTGTHALMRTSGTTCVLIKHDRRPPLGLSPTDAVLDVDVTVRHIDVTLGVGDCNGLCKLLSAYLPELEEPATALAEDTFDVKDSPVKPLFREDFWYFDGLHGSGDSHSRDLNFDSLSILLEQYASARARLAEERADGEGGWGRDMQSSLGRSDLFFDCVDGSEDVGEGSKDAKASIRDTAKIRVRNTGLDVTLLLSQHSLSLRQARSATTSSVGECRIQMQMRRMSQTLHRNGRKIQSVAEIGTLVADYHDAVATMLRPVRILEVVCDAGSSPSVQITCSMGGAVDGVHGRDETDIAVDIQCLPIAGVVHTRIIALVNEFITRAVPQSVEFGRSRIGEGGRSVGVTRCKNVSENVVRIATTVPKISVRVPADPRACSSEAYAALVQSVRNGSSPVGWEVARALEEAAPALVVEIEGVVLAHGVESADSRKTTVECSRVRCKMVLPFNAGDSGSHGADHVALYFLEGIQSPGSPSEARLKVEYGLAEDIRKTGRLGLARPLDADLKFLHTWEPSDGADSGLKEAGSSANFSGQRDHESDVAGGKPPAGPILLCDLPRLAVELSRLELVVLADILAGLAPPVDSGPADGATEVHDLYEAPRQTVAPSALEVFVEARGATIVLHEAAAFAEEPGPHSYVLNLGNACLHLGGDGGSDQHPAPMVTVSSADACVHESLRTTSSHGLVTGPLLFRAGCDASSVYPSMEDLPGLGFNPVLYQTKWAKGTSPLAAELALSVSGAGVACKTITATLNLYDVTLRHTVASSWLPRLLGLVVGDVPAGKGALVNNSEPGLVVGTNGAVEPDGNLTKMFITVFNGVVDYMPPSRSHCSVYRPPSKSGTSNTSSSTGSPARGGRAVFPIGVLRVSSNMVAGAHMQGFKVVIRDVALHMSNRPTNYRNEDTGLCRGALKSRSQHPCTTEAGSSSVQEYLETSQFVQIATLNFLDAFLRTRTQVIAPRDAFAAVELWMGILHVYTCQDSLSTCHSLLGEWWDLVNECRTAAVGPGQPSLPEAKHRIGSASQEGLESKAPTSLLDEVEQDAFLPGSTKDSLRTADGEGRRELAGPKWCDAETSLGGQPSTQRPLVIEDYYCVSIKPPEDHAVHESLVVGVDEGQYYEQVDVTENSPDHTSSFLSEEGPAQWLTTPNLGLQQGDSLSMESAGETSESEGDEERASDSNALSLQLSQRLDGGSKRNAFGFSLPAPIELELKSRHDADHLKANEEEKVSSSALSEPTSRWREEGESKSEEESDQSQQGDNRLQHDELFEGESDVPPNASLDAPLSPELDVQPILDATTSETLSERDDSSFEKQKSALAPSDGTSSGDAKSTAQQAQHGVQTNVAPLHVEQEARWLGKDRESSAATDVRDEPLSTCEPEEFRVYPHYIPIPVTAEAASLSFHTGNPLLVLGHGLDKNADGEAEVKGPEQIDQNLQFQLAIHDLSICWRLFKGRDWLHGCDGEVDRKGLGEFDVGDQRNQPWRVRRGSHHDAPAGAKRRAHERSREYPAPSSENSKPRKAELLDALLENYQDDGGGRGHKQPRRRASRQPKVKLLRRESGPTGSARRSGRDTSCMLEVVLQNSSLRLDNFHPGPPPSLLSNLLFTIKNLHASDTLTSSRPRKMLQHWRDDVNRPREYGQKMLTIRMTARSPSDHYCPEDTPLGDELMLKVRVLPVRLSFGQHTVDFLRSFASQAQSARGLDVKDASKGSKTPVEKEASPIFVSCCDVGPWKVNIDYQPRAIKVKALQQGEYLELLNLFPLEGVHLTLKKLLLTGLSGWNGVGQLLLQSWVQDITSNQLHRFLAGTTAVRPLVTVGKGVADLVLLPVEQYRRDGRVLRGLRKGTQSFLRAITVETLHTSHRVASYVARTLDDIVAQPGSRASLRGLEYYDEQPTGVLDSLEHAYDALVKEVQVAAQTVVAIPYEEQEEVMGPHGRSYVRSVARALPVALLRPVVGASEALSCTLLGFRNYMSPVIRKEEEGRWR